MTGRIVSADEAEKIVGHRTGSEHLAAVKGLAVGEVYLVGHICKGTVGCKLNQTFSSYGMRFMGKGKYRLAHRNGWMAIGRKKA